MKRSAPLQRKARLPSSGKPRARNAKRRRSEFARCYHSKERVAWVKEQRCVACGYCRLVMDNMHIRGDGAGRKADFTLIVPCCRKDHDAAHRLGVATWAEIYGLDLEALAARTQERWELHCEAWRAHRGEAREEEAT